MKRVVLIVVVLAIIGVAAYGYSHGWYSLARETDDHRTKIDLTIDQDKIQEDKEKAKKKAEELENKVKEKAGEAGDKVKKDADKP
jgi:hypothetical protein